MVAIVELVIRRSVYSSTSDRVIQSQDVLEGSALHYEHQPRESEYIEAYQDSMDFQSPRSVITLYRK